MATEPLYVVERVFPATERRLWRAWTDAAEMERWYHPVGLAVVPSSVTSEPVVGGLWTVGVDVPSHGFVAWFHGRYTEVVAHRRLVHTLFYTQDHAAFLARDESDGYHVVSIDIAPVDGGARVRWSQFGEMDAEQVAQTQAGMESYFDSLASHLEAFPAAP
jgi:uncharacterized protein YndB with AHSA1/START domain